VVLLYDSSDSLPLPVHLYASMLAHLHARLNFIIYGLINRNLRSGFAAHLLACCQVSSDDCPAAATAAACRNSSARQRSGRDEVSKCEVRVSRSLASVEYHQLQEMIGTGEEGTDAVVLQQFLTIRHIN